MPFSLKILRFYRYCSLVFSLFLSFPLLSSLSVLSLLFSSSFKYRLPCHPTFSRASLTFKYYSRSYSLPSSRNPSLSLSIRALLVISISFARIVRSLEKSLRMPGVSSCSLSSAIITTPAVASPNTGFICRRTCLPSSRRRARPRWRQTAEER